MTNNPIFEIKVKRIDGNRIIKGKAILFSDKFIFIPENDQSEKIEIPKYRLVQTGCRKRFQFFPYKFYLKTMSGMVYYFNTPKAKIATNELEKVIY